MNIRELQGGTKEHIESSPLELIYVERWGAQLAQRIRVISQPEPVLSEYGEIGPDEFFVSYHDVPVNDVERGIMTTGNVDLKAGSGGMSAPPGYWLEACYEERAAQPRELKR